MKKIKKRLNLIKEVQKNTNWGFFKTINDIKKAKKLGISSYEYKKHKVWALEEDKRKKLAQRLRIISKIQDLSGKTKKEVKEILNNLKKQGINAKECLKYRTFELSEKEIKELKKALETKKENLKKNEDWYINVVMEKTGIAKDKAVELMEEARKKGYTYRKFISSGLYAKSLEEIKNLENYVKKPSTKTKEEVEHTRETLAKYKKEIMEKMDWNEAQYLLNYLKCYNNCGCSYSEYYLYRLYEKPAKETKKYITQDLHIKMQLRYCEYNNGLDYFEKKSLFNTTFKDFVKRKWFTNEDLTFEKFEENIKDLDEIVYKPLDNLGGEGVKKYKVNKSSEENKEVFDKITNNGPAIIEQCIVQDDKIAKFWPKTVNSIRIMTLVKDGKVNFLNSVIKFGTGDCADNLAQGGIAAGIDIKKGEICTDGVNKKGEVFKKHPNSNVKFKGFKIPHWDKVLTECEKAAKVVKDMPYIGWDISITKDGEVEIIEGNHNQAGFLVQYPFAILENKGKRDTIEPYLWF